MYTKYASLILLGIRNDNNAEVYNMTKELGIVHLFVISGFHIGILYFALERFFKVIRINETHRSLITMMIILIYLYLLNFPIASTRAFMFLTAILINKY